MYKTMFLISIATLNLIFACSSDFDCSFGNKCVKKPFSFKGVCMTPVDNFGIQKPYFPKTDSVYPNTGRGHCNFNLDCPIGFSCDSVYKVCVKN